MLNKYDSFSIHSYEKFPSDINFLTGGRILEELYWKSGIIKIITIIIIIKIFNY